MSHILTIEPKLTLKLAMQMKNIEIGTKNIITRVSENWFLQNPKIDKSATPYPHRVKTMT